MYASKTWTNENDANVESIIVCCLFMDGVVTVCGGYLYFVVLNS